MVSFNSSIQTGGKIPLGENSLHSLSRGHACTDMKFSLTDCKSKQLLSLRHQQLGTKRKGLPLASLTATVGQLQPFQQQLQPLGNTRQSNSSVVDGPQTGHNTRKGWVSIGLLLQPATGRVVDTHECSPMQQKQQQACVCRHKARHKNHSSCCQQHPQQLQQQQCTCVEDAAATKQSMQQQSESRQDTSGPPATSWLEVVARAKLLVAGAASAIVSRTAMAPLERVKMDLLLKTSSRSAVDTAVWVWQREGLAGFWKGNGINLLRTAPFKALNFFSFDMYSKALAGVMPDGSNSARFVAGALAGITATLICFPLDVLRTRLMAPWGHKYGGPLTTLKCMVQYEGPGALYAGVVPAVIGMAPSGAVFYGVYDLLKARHLAALSSSSSVDADSSVTEQPQPQQHELPVLYTLLYGALAGAAAETFLYPLEVIRRKMQLQSMAAGAAVLASPGNAAGAAAAAATPHILRQHGLKAASGALVPSGAGVGAFGAAGIPGAAAMARLAAACSAIVKADGVAGFYAGLLPNMLQVLPSAALSYGTYESVKQVLGAP